MSTLLLRLAAPLQAWGTDSKFEVRRTNREPSKSGVIGLLAAALGLRRDADLSELSALRFGVRVDRNGEVIKDFHMAKAEKTSHLSLLSFRRNFFSRIGIGRSKFLGKDRERATESLLSAFPWKTFLSAYSPFGARYSRGCVRDCITGRRESK